MRRKNRKVVLDDRNDIDKVISTVISCCRINESKVEDKRVIERERDRGERERKRGR